MRLTDAPSTSQKVWTTTERATPGILCRQRAAQMLARLLQFRICAHEAADAGGTQPQDRQRSATNKIHIVGRRAFVFVRENSSACAIVECASLGSTTQLLDARGYEFNRLADRAINLPTDKPGATDCDRPTDRPAVRRAEFIGTCNRRVCVAWIHDSIA